MIVSIHIGLSLVFFLIGFLMRYGFAKSFAVYLHRRIPHLSQNDFNEYTVRRFVGETSIKLGSVIFLIAMVGLFKPESFNQAMIMGWLCFLVLAVGSITFMDKLNLIEMYKRAKASNAHAETSSMPKIEEEKTSVPKGSL